MLKTMDRNALRGFLKGDDTTAFPTPLMGFRWPELVESKQRGGNMKLHVPQKNKSGKTYCGPTVLSALSGKSYKDVLVFIDVVLGTGCSRETKWMKFYDLHSCIQRLGFRAEVEILDDCEVKNLCSLEDWIKGRDFLSEEMGDDPLNDVWVIALTKHFVIVQGDSFLDNHTAKPVPIASAPFQKKRVRKAIKVS